MLSGPGPGAEMQPEFLLEPRKSCSLWLSFHSLDYLHAAAVFGESWSKNRRSCWLHLSGSPRCSTAGGSTLPPRSRSTQVFLSTCFISAMARRTGGRDGPGTTTHSRMQESDLTAAAELQRGSPGCCQMEGGETHIVSQVQTRPLEPKLIPSILVPEKLDCSERWRELAYVKAGRHPDV